MCASSLSMAAARSWPASSVFRARSASTLRTRRSASALRARSAPDSADCETDRVSIMGHWPAATRAACITARHTAPRQRSPIPRVGGGWVRGSGISGLTNLRLRDSMPDRIAHQARRVMNIELLHELGAVRLDGLRADREPCRDRLGGMTFGDQLQHLALAYRERGGRVLRREISLGDRAGDTGRQVHLAAANALDGLHQVARRLALEDVAPYAAAQRLGDVLRFVMLREHHQLDARTEARQLERRVQAVELRHADVHHGDIGVLAAHQAHRLAAVGRLPATTNPALCSRVFNPCLTST